LQRAFKGEAWHGPSLRELLADVTSNNAAARPVANAHKIWEIVLHLTAWHRAVKRRLEGEAVQLSPQEDWPAADETHATAWKNALAALENSHQQLCETILQLTEAQLQNIVPGKNYSVYFMLHGLIQHDLYHAGQIALLKKA
jgi:uncharacterized damage-inducible protein DinB